MNILLINPKPSFQAAMAELLGANAPVYGIEFTLPNLASLLTENIDGQHTDDHPEWAGLCAIEIALSCEIPPDGAAVAVVRPDADALGAIAVLEIRRWCRIVYGDEKFNSDMYPRIAYIAKHDAFQFGEWPGPQDPALHSNPDRVLFGALSALCMDFKVPIESRVALMRQWIETGECDGLTEMLAKIEAEHLRAQDDAEVILQEGNLVVLRAHTMGATAIGYCHAPVVVIENDRFCFPGVEGEYLKYTVCQWKEGYVDLGAVARALNEIEQAGTWIIAFGLRQWVKGKWGGSPTIIGSPQGVSSSLDLSPVVATVKPFLL